MIHVDSALLNARVREVCDKGDEFKVKGLEDTGKAIPYIGWYWRDVDFSEQITLGFAPQCGTWLERSRGFVGFMENNKWGYDQWVTTEEETDTIISKLVAMFSAGVTLEALQDLFNYLQTLRREFVECPACYGTGETGRMICNRCRGFGKLAKEAGADSEQGGPSEPEAIG